MFPRERATDTTVWPGCGLRLSDGGGNDTPDADAGLEDVARDEHEYLHERLRQELGREPTEEELNDWLRKHTEGY